MSKGLIHIYCGDGKGKTTAAMGLAVRAAGWKKKVLIVQFLKGRPSGEVDILQSLPGVTLLRGKDIKKFSWDMDADEKLRTRSMHEELLKSAVAELSSSYDLLVLDEALGACAVDLLDEEILLAFLRSKPEELEVVLTGRDPSDEMLGMADYITEMQKIKHPYEEGIAARKGVEF